MRAAAILRLYVGLSEAEAVDVLGCSIGTVKSQLHDARQRLIPLVEDRRPGSNRARPSTEEVPR
jgi:DNA-directed RNA polymerase specialized sigma24 family protein